MKIQVRMRRSRQATNHSRAGHTRVRAAVAGALLTPLVLTACGGLPTNDRVREGLPVLSQPQQGVQVLPAGPESGSSPDQIVRGFLLANAGFSDDHEVARQFLTEDPATQWSPTSRVVVYDDSSLDYAEADQVVNASIAVEGRVDEYGYLTQEPEETTMESNFEMTQVDGQWRISSFPEDFGLWLTRTEFDRLYRSDELTYLAEHEDVFIPDTRWFPRYTQGSGLPTAMARSQLRTPPPYLEGAVRESVPEGLELSAAGVPVNSEGVAMVDLTGTGVGQSEELVTELWAQLTHTLMAAPGVSGVQVQTGGRDLEVESTTGRPVETPVSSVRELGFAEAGVDTDYALLRERSELSLVDPLHYRLRNYEASPDEELPELPTVPASLTHLAADEAVDNLAALGPEGESLWWWSEGESVELDTVGSGLVTPSFDHKGHLWVAGMSRDTPRVWALDTSQDVDQPVARPVDAPWLDETTGVSHFQVGPDGQRALIVMVDAESGEEEVMLTAISRNDEGQPVELTEPRPIAPTVTSVSSISWGSPTSVVLLGTQAGDSVPTPYLLPIGGWLEPLSTVEAAESVRGVPTGEGHATVLISDLGRIYTEDGRGWYAGRSGDDLIIPGS